MMNYKIVLPQVEVEKDANFTRKFRVWVSGNVRLDLDLDENEYECDFDIGAEKEMRVDIKYEADKDLSVYRHTTATEDVGKNVLSNKHLNVYCS